MAFSEAMFGRHALSDTKVRPRSCQYSACTLASIPKFLSPCVSVHVSLILRGFTLVLWEVNGPGSLPKEPLGEGSDKTDLDE